MSGRRGGARGTSQAKRRRWLRRKLRIRRRVRGTAERPRLTVYKSNHYTYVQVIDDFRGHTLLSASNREPALSDAGNTVAGAARLGTAVGERLRELDITQVVFDRNGYAYHGMVRSLADAVRNVGIRL
jgi:large subunit ribosomal protein L18